MKTYDSERKKLFAWLMARTEEYEKKCNEKYWRNGHYVGKGQDCPEDLEHAADVREYNRRLMERKRKYCKI